MTTTHTTRTAVTHRVRTWDANGNLRPAVVHALTDVRPSRTLCGVRPQNLTELTGVHAGRPVTCPRCRKALAGMTDAGAG